MDSLIIIGVAALVGGLIFLLVRGGGVPAAGGGCCGGGGHGHGAKGQDEAGNTPQRKDKRQPKAADAEGCCGDAAERAVQASSAGPDEKGGQRPGGCH